MEVYTILELKTLKLYTTFETGNLEYTVSCLIGLMFDAIQSGGSGGEGPPESTGLWGGARPPNEGDGRGGTVNGFWGMVPFRGMVKVGFMALREASVRVFQLEKEVPFYWPLAKLAIPWKLTFSSLHKPKNRNT